jgi:hypothetical protein
MIIAVLQQGKWGLRGISGKMRSYLPPQPADRPHRLESPEINDQYKYADAIRTRKFTQIIHRKPGQGGGLHGRLTQNGHRLPGTMP